MKHSELNQNDNDDANPTLLEIERFFTFLQFTELG